MKKVSLFFSALVCLAAMIVVGCSEQETAVEKGKTVQIGLEIEKAMLVQAKSGALDGDYDEVVPYCDEEELDFKGYVQSNVTIVSDKGRTIVSNEDWTWDIELSDYTDDANDDHIARLSDLRQIDLQAGESYATITFNTFEVYKSGQSGDTLKFITPTTTSAYAGYVNTPVPYMFDDATVSTYEKQYVKMEVLCFNEEDIPLFGFAWTDFDVVYGDEICIFINYEGDSRETYHSVYTGEVDALYMNTTYWSKTAEQEEAFCIPCPGDWEMNGLTIVTALDTMLIEARTIAAFLTPMVSTETSLQLSKSTNHDYEITLDFADGLPFLHFYLTK